MLPDPSNFGKPRCNTRTDPAVNFESLLGVSASPSASQPSGNAAAPPTASPAPSPATGSSASTQPRAPRSSQYFENLSCKVVDDPLIKLTQELANINPAKRPIAASMLTRAMLETTLIYKVRQAGKMKALMASNPRTQPGADPGLDAIVAFCKNFSNGVFSETE